MLRKFLVAIGSVLAMAAQSYQIDTAHSSASFTAKHMMVNNVTGHFSKMRGTIVYDAKDLAKSSVEAVIDTTTLDSKQAKRDAHLKGEDFLDVEKFPTLSFNSTRVYKDGDVYLVDGNLTLHGVTKPVKLTLSDLTPEVKSPQGGFLRGAHATTKISRSAFGLRYNKLIEAGGVVVGDEVLVKLDIQATRPAP